MGKKKRERKMARWCHEAHVEFIADTSCTHLANLVTLLDNIVAKDCHSFQLSHEAALNLLSAKNFLRVDVAKYQESQRLQLEKELQNVQPE